MNQSNKLLYIAKHHTMSDSLNILDAEIVKDSIQNKYRPDYPFYISWNITNNCNTSCVYCSNEREFSSNKNLSNDNIVKVIETLKKFGIKHVRLLGGEPTFIENFDYILDLLLKNSIYVSFSTNGYGINDKVIDILKKYPSNSYYISISLDSVVQQNNDLNRGDNSFLIAIKAIKKLKTIKNIKVGVCSVITEHTSQDIYKTYKYLEDLKVTSHLITGVLVTGNATKDMVVKVDDNIINQIYNVIKYSNENIFATKASTNIGYTDYNTYDQSQVHPYTEVSDLYFRIKCNACITRLHIDSNGDVYPCDYLKQKKFILGNMVKDDFQDIWNNPICVYISALRRRDKKECSTCAIGNCSTGCMGLSFEKYSDILRKDPSCISYIDNE